MAEKENPLLVQLNWGKDDREGRFLLKRETEKTMQVLYYRVICTLTDRFIKTFDLYVLD